MRPRPILTVYSRKLSSMSLKWSQQAISQAVTPHVHMTPSWGFLAGSLNDLYPELDSRLSPDRQPKLEHQGLCSQLTFPNIKYWTLKISSLAENTHYPFILISLSMFLLFLALKVDTHRSVSNAWMDLTSQVAYYYSPEKLNWQNLPVTSIFLAFLRRRAPHHPLEIVLSGIVAPWPD